MSSPIVALLSGSSCQHDAAAHAHELLPYGLRLAHAWEDIGCLGDKCCRSVRFQIPCMIERGWPLIGVTIPARHQLLRHDCKQLGRARSGFGM